MVSELDELGTREGEALCKIDSLGFQLANLLDPNVSFDVSLLFFPFALNITMSSGFIRLCVFDFGKECNLVRS